VGWGILLLLTAVMMLNHFGGMLYIATSSDQRQMFEVFALLELFALIVLLIPYRRRELWAWVATWVQILPLALVPVFSQDTLGLFYGATAGLMTIGQLLTLRGFLAVRGGDRV
jgi:hypothetical protein